MSYRSGFSQPLELYCCSLRLLTGSDLQQLIETEKDHKLEIHLYNTSFCTFVQDGLDSQPSELDPQQESGAGAREGEAGGDPIAMLKDSIPGTPGEDYPIYAEAPETKFTCDSRVNGGKPCFIKMGHSLMTSLIITL